MGVLSTVTAVYRHRSVIRHRRIEAGDRHRIIRQSVSSRRRHFGMHFNAMSTYLSHADIENDEVRLFLMRARACEKASNASGEDARRIWVRHDRRSSI